MKKLVENIVRNYIRSKMREHQLKHVFTIIQEEYSRMYYEDNIPTRLDYLAELINETSPNRYGCSLKLVNTDIKPLNMVKERDL